MITDSVVNTLYTMFTFSVYHLCFLLSFSALDNDVSAASGADWIVISAPLELIGSSVF